MTDGVADRRRDLVVTASLMRRARLGAAGLTMVQFTLYQPPPGIPMPYPRAPMAAAVVAVLLVINAASWLATQRLSITGLRVSAVTEMFLDTALTYAIVLLFTFDPHSSLWALLIMPVLEGASRASLTGAVAVWAAVSVGYTVREAWGATAYDYREFGLDGVTYVVGIIGIVAASMGLMARSLRRRTEAHRVARAEAEMRAEQLNRAKELLAHRAYHDDLTGVANRAGFLQRLEARLDAPDHASPVGVLFVDLDGLKVVNDDLGHAAGDELLQRAAQRLRRAVRGGDVVARLGGDEFTVLAVDADVEALTALADRVVDEFRAPFTLRCGEVGTTVSLGIAVGHPGEDDPGSVVSAADTAMYAAKGAGGDRWLHGQVPAVR